jgi:hypothetical protein
MPAQDPEVADRKLFMQCQVKILRIDPAAEAGSYGLACEIEDYRLLRSEYDPLRQPGAATGAGV